MTKAGSKIIATRFNFSVESKTNTNILEIKINKLKPLLKI